MLQALLFFYDTLCRVVMINLAEMWRFFIILQVYNDSLRFFPTIVTKLEVCLFIPRFSAFFDLLISLGR